jgi:hypothetical protein
MTGPAGVEHEPAVTQGLVALHAQHRHDRAPSHLHQFVELRLRGRCGQPRLEGLVPGGRVGVLERGPVLAGVAQGAQVSVLDAGGAQ